MRRIVVLTLLFGGMMLVLPLGVEAQGSRTLLTFGFLMLAAYTVGEIADGARLPKIVGYLAAGVVFGPSGLGTVTSVGMERLAPVSGLAIALIAFLAGTALRGPDLRERVTTLLRILGAETLATFVLLAAAVYALQDAIPFLRDATPAAALAAAMLFAAVATVHSPAVTLALLTETRARGPVTSTTLGVVLLADVTVVLLFTAVLSIARWLAPVVGASAPPSLGMVAWEIAGAPVVGLALGAAVALYLRFVGRELILFTILVALFGLEIARLAHVEVLLTLLVAGFVAENASSRGDELRAALERSAAPVFVVFFALSGAKVVLSTVIPLLPFVIPLVVVRIAGIRLGTGLGMRWAGADRAQTRHVWRGLVSQAGVAIGLAALLADAYGTVGEQLRDLLLALIAVNETIGPILFRSALEGSGEAVRHAGAEARAPGAPPRPFGG